MRKSYRKPLALFLVMTITVASDRLSKGGCEGKKESERDHGTKTGNILYI